MAHNIALKSSPASLRNTSLSMWPAALTPPGLSVQCGPSRNCFRNQQIPTSPCRHTGAHLFPSVALALHNFDGTQHVVNHSSGPPILWTRVVISAWVTWERCTREVQTKVNFDLWHRARPLPPLESEQKVWIRTNGRVDPGHVRNPTPTPRSYMVETFFGVVLRNQVHVTPRPAETNQATTTSNSSDSRAVTHSRTGTLVLLGCIFSTVAMTMGYIYQSIPLSRLKVGGSIALMYISAIDPSTFSLGCIT